MSLLHQILHEMTNRLTYASQRQREDAHAAIDDLPEYLEHPGEDQLRDVDDGQDDDEPPVKADPTTTQTSESEQAS